MVLTHPIARQAWALVAAVAWLLALGVVGTTAQSTPDLDWPVTDLVAAVEGETSSIEDAVGALRERSDTQLFVLYADTTADLAVTDYAQAVADANSLGVGDAMYVVAVGDRTHALWLGDGALEKVSLDRQDGILLDAEERLADGDLAGAPVVVAEGLQEALSAGGSPVLPVLVVLGLGVVGVGAWYAWSRRRQIPAEAAAAQPPTISNAQLLELDEQVRNATNELGFVEAMYGTEAVRPYAAAIDEATAELTAAFGIRQRLDDAEPEDPATQRSMLEELSARVTRAQGILGTQRDHLRELRDIEKDAPRLIPALEAQLLTLEQRLPEADRQRAALEASYAPGNWEAVRGNRTEAAKRIPAARTSLAEASAALATKDSGRAAVEVQEATQAVTEATTLLDALDAAVAQLAAAAGQVGAEIAGAATDIDAAAQALAAAGSAGGATRLAEARAALQRAQQLAAGVAPDVLGALEQANAAEAIADELVAGARATEVERERQAGMLQGAIASAQARVAMASDYVSTRRHGVGTEARTRASEAGRHLDTAIALSGSDPARALAEAQRAEALADEAYRLADADFGAWDQRPPAEASRGGSSVLGDMGGIILGTIIGNVLSGGSSGGGPGWGGTPWGGSSGGGGRSRPPTPRFPSGGGGLGGGGGRAGGGGGRAGGSAGGRARGGRW